MDVDEGALAKELVELAKRPLGEALAKRDLMPGLLEIAQTHFGDDWDQDPVRAIELTIRAAIAGLEDAPFRTEHRMKKQEVAHRLFNLPEPRFNVVPVELEGIDGHRYSEVLTDLYKRAGVSEMKEVTRRKFFTDLRKELVGKLLHPDFPNWPAPRPSVRGMLVRDELRSYYISRPDYEAAIRERREAGIKKIWLHGDAGTGKTRLAAGAHGDVPEAEVSVLKAINESTLSRSVSAFLVDHNVSAEAINPINIWTLLLDVLNSGNHPAIIVFDDMFEGDVLDLLMRETKSTLIFTSVGLPPSTFQGSSLEVVDMGSDEAEGMIHSRLKEISGEDIDALVSISGGRPLAIEHSCAFILETHMPIQEFCNAVLERPVSTLQVAGERFGRTLTAVYELMLGRLATTPRALWALDLLLFSTASSLSPTDLAELWAVGTDFVAPNKSPDWGRPEFNESSALVYGILPGVQVTAARDVRFLDDASRVEMLGALRILERYGLVRARADNNISMHQLTRYILRALRDDNAPAIFAHLRTEAVKFLDADGWSGGEALPHSLDLWMRRVHEAVAVCWIPAEELRKAPPEEIAKIAILTVALLRMHRHIGYGINPIVQACPRVGVALFYQFTPDTDEAVRPFVTRAHKTFEREFSFDYSALNKTFDPSFKPAEEYDGSHSPTKQFQWNDVRLKYETEWDPIYRDVDLTHREAVINKPPKKALLSFSSDHTRDGFNALRISTIYYQQARWNDAIGALEHAWSCLIKVGGDAESLWGALDASRRLSRLHLRVGQVNEATLWLMRAHETYVARILTPIDSYPMRYGLLDKLTDVRLVQAQNELEFTRAALRVDDPGDNFTTDDLAEFCQSVIPEAMRSYDWVQQSGSDRFLPEILIYLARLQLLSADIAGATAMNALRSFFSSNSGLEYQAGLLDIQMATFGAAFVALSFIVPAEEFNEYMGEVSDEVRDGFKSVREADRSVIGDEMFAKFYKFNQNFGDKYWYAKGLCATYLVAKAAERDPEWLGHLMKHVVVATDAINRPDWVEKLEAYGDKNIGFWLTAY